MNTDIHFTSKLYTQLYWNISSISNRKIRKKWCSILEDVSRGQAAHLPLESSLYTEVNKEKAHKKIYFQSFRKLKNKQRLTLFNFFKRQLSRKCRVIDTTAPSIFLISIFLFGFHVNIESAVVFLSGIRQFMLSKKHYRARKQNRHKNQYRNRMPTHVTSNRKKTTVKQT